MEFYYTVGIDEIRLFMPADYLYLLPASSWARYGLRPPRIPTHVTRVAADCGGFVATFKWGDYRYTPEQYVGWLSSFNPEWAAMMDYCCEDEITSGRVGVVRERQQRTTEMAHHLWHNYRDAVRCWVPTIQGWSVDDYRAHAVEMRPLLAEMAEHYRGAAWRVGIGTLCRRASVQMIMQVLRAVADELPEFQFHLWGVKLGTLRARVHLPNVVSVDSAMWHGGWSRGVTTKRPYQESGLTKRQYDYQVALPRYDALIRAALSQDKQMSLF